MYFQKNVDINEYNEKIMILNDILKNNISKQHPFPRNVDING